MRLNSMKRRHLLSIGASAAALSACQPATTSTAAGSARANEPVRQWKMVTSWPTNFPGLGTTAARLAENITRMSGGRIKVKLYGAGELVPAFEVFDAVSRGTAEMGHSGAYYWRGKHEAAQFFAAVPFGLTALEMNGWLLHGGGMALWRELYAPFNLVPFPAGNSGVQMGGWFNKEINSLADLQGLKMRIPGLGGEVLAALGGAPVNIPGGELFTSLQQGTIDAAEWVGPYNDLAFGLHKAAKFCYYPGWQEPGAVLECMVSKTAFDALPADLQAIVEIACLAANTDMLAEYSARNPIALKTLSDEHGVQFRPFPADVIAAFKETAERLVREIAAKDPFTQKVYDSFTAFRALSLPWMAMSDQAYAAVR
jgi:TRAP-type mannitol/chloroaromatic compound transport system substrate-binding protein